MEIFKEGNSAVATTCQGAWSRSQWIIQHKCQIWIRLAQRCLEYGARWMCAGWKGVCINFLFMCSDLSTKRVLIGWGVGEDACWLWRYEYSWRSTWDYLHSNVTGLCKLQNWKSVWILIGHNAQEVTLKFELEWKEDELYIQRNSTQVMHSGSVLPPIKVKLLIYTPGQNLSNQDFLKCFW